MFIIIFNKRKISQRSCDVYLNHLGLRDLAIIEFAYVPFTNHKKKFNKPTTE